MSNILSHPPARWSLLVAAAILTLLVLWPTRPAAAHPPATIAEADGKGNVDVNIVYYADLGCTSLTDVREGAPGNIEPPQRTLVVTVTLDRQPGDCTGQAQTIERRISIADRRDALSVDIFFVDPDGRFVRSQRPRIYREIAECEEKPATTQTC